MRLLAIGDIHGCFKALSTLSEAVAFQPGDIVVTLGDYVDRGPGSRQVLDFLIALAGRITLVPLKGNHEIMMLAARHDAEAAQQWFMYGGADTLESYGGARNIPESHWFFLQRTQSYYESDKNFFVHASVDPYLPLAVQTEDMLHWESLTDRGPHCSGKRMICGHTAQHSGLPLNLGHTVCIDTRAHGGGWLTCLDVGSNLYWQANEAGAIRTGSL